MKKAQIQYMETIFVLLILIVIIFIGIIVIYSFYTKSLTDKRESLQDIDSVTLTSSIISMPEFTCGRNTNCIDATKLLAFQIHSNNEYYKTLFKNMDINIKIIYPTTQQAPCTETKFNQEAFPTNCNNFEVFTSSRNYENKEIIQSPVQIYFPSKQKKALGILNIIVYKK